MIIHFLTKSDKCIGDLHVLTGHPVLLYSLAVNGDLRTCVNLFPSAGGLGYWKPTLSAHTLTGRFKDKLLIHEKKVCSVAGVV